MNTKDAQVLTGCTWADADSVADILEEVFDITAAQTVCHVRRRTGAWGDAMSGPRASKSPQPTNQPTRRTS